MDNNPEHNITEDINSNSPVESQCNSIDPRLLQVNSGFEVEGVSNTQDLTIPFASQYFSYDETRAASPPSELQYSQYFVPGFETEFPYNEWDTPFVDVESSQFFEELMFR